MIPSIAVTVGDYNGIGPEVALKSVLDRRVRKVCVPILVGPEQVFQYYAGRMDLSIRFERLQNADMPRKGQLLSNDAIPLYEPKGSAGISITPGRVSKHAGRVAALALEQAVTLTKAGRTSAVVTAPVSKRALHLAGTRFPGQTEMVQSLTSSPHVAMMLVSATMRVGLATIHIPIRSVATFLTPDLLKERIMTIHEALRTDWRIQRPRLAILGLNPHAGESGDLGREEQTIIMPVMRELRRKRLRLTGPFPADAFFARYQPGQYDAIVAMYHDQGLIPLKMSAAGRAVNVSVGLSIIRTSPDHGTAFDIAGKGVADPGSMIEALRLAAAFANNRRTPLSRKR